MMPRDTMVPESAASMRARSPDPSVGGNERKRRRKVLSCYDCRRRKLQCDRAMPACSRCTKAGLAANCLYIDDSNDGPMRDGDGKGPFDSHSSRPVQAAVPPTGDVLSRLEYQDRRIKQLEAQLAQTGHTQAQDPVSRMRASKLPLTPESVVAADNCGTVVNDRETMLLRGKSFKTQFHGTTHPGALIAHIPDLNLFTKEIFERFPAIVRIRQDMRALEDRTDYAGSRPQVRTGDDLKALLPAKAEADECVHLYIDNYNSIYNILHLPSFWQEYNQLWLDVPSASPHFVAIVLLMTAAAQCLTSTQPWLYTANSSSAREKAISCIQACDDWIRTQSQKHVTAADFQIRFLLLFAQQVSARKYKRTWTDSGTLLRFCMAAGLHRNPDLLRKKTSALDKELRRRVWYSVVELELQASFDRGMIPAQWPLQADCSSPNNISDEDIDQTSEHLPSPKPTVEFTTSSYLCTAAKSILFRHGLNTTLNNIRQTLTFDDVKRFSEEIEAQLESVPEWTGPGADVARARLILTLRQYLLVLHDRQIRQAETTMERNFSRMVLIDNATRTMDEHRKLIDNGCYALEILCQDQLRAALTICHVATTVDIRADSAIGQIIEHHTSRVLDEAIAMLTDKVIRFGREQRQLWIALAAHGSLKARKDPNQRATYMQEAVEKVTRPYYKIMACQEDVAAVPFTGEPGKPGKSRDELPNGMSDYMPPVPTPQPYDQVPGVADAEILDLDELAAWTFEDWGVFNPAQMQHAFSDPYPPMI